MTDSSNKKTLYEILGVKPDANLVDIQIAHEGLLGAAEGALDAAERVALKEAYRILADSRRRAAYDQSLRRRARASVESVDEDDEPSGRSKTPLVVAAVVVLLVGGWWFTRSPEKSASSPAVP